MAPTTARQAVEYALSAELLKLYGLTLGGWILTFVAQFLVTSFSLISRVVGGLLLVAGVGTTFLGVVAVAYKLLADSREGTATR